MLWIKYLNSRVYMGTISYGYLVSVSSCSLRYSVFNRKGLMSYLAIHHTRNFLTKSKENLSHIS